MLFVYVLLFLTGIAAMYLYQLRVDNGPMEYYVGSETECLGRVMQIEKKNEKYSIVVKTDYGIILCSYYGKIDDYKRTFRQHVRFSGMIERPEPAGNPRAFDYSLYLKSRGIHYISTPGYMDFYDGSISYYDRFRRWIFLTREDFIEKLNLDDETDGIIRGVLFGDTNELDEEVYEDFRKNSTAHVLAVSGLHIGVLFGLFSAVRKKRNTLFITVIFVVFTLVYGCATLWSVSVTRAIVLMYIMIFGNYIDRRYDLITAAALVAAVFAAVNPYVIFGAGFQMSFLAVVSIAFLTPVTERLLPLNLAGAVSVQLGMIPYMIYSFNGISLAGLAVNIPVVFLISVLVPAGVLSFFIFAASGITIPAIPAVLGLLSKLTVFINHLFAEKDFLYLSLPSMKPGVLILIYGLMFFCVSEYFQVHVKRRQYRKVFMPLALIIAVFVGVWQADRTPFDKADVVFLDVGQGDSVHIKADKERNILIDGGGNVNYNVGNKVLKPYLLKNGYGKIDLALATHLHTDHYLGLQQLSESFDIKEIITKAQAGDVIRLNENSSIHILWPEGCNSESDDENLNSLIFKVNLDNVSVLITGDITEEGEKMLVSKYAGTDVLKADVLKVAHHGSSYSSCDAFIDAVNPKVAVISVGKNNYGHPGQDVIEKLEEKGIMVFRTDLDGAVGIIRKGDGFSVCTKINRKSMRSESSLRT
ncbi:MAG: DNA internalization-related competence protein ComEC/Rec2 [Emergencia sp.]